MFGTVLNTPLGYLIEKVADLKRTLSNCIRAMVVHKKVDTGPKLNVQIFLNVHMASHA